MNSFIKRFLTHNANKFVEKNVHVPTCALAVHFYTYFKFVDKPIVIITSKNSVAEELALDINALEKNVAVQVPSSEILPFENVSPIVDITAQRHKARWLMKQSKKKIYICPINSATSKVQVLSDEFNPLKLTSLDPTSTSDGINSIERTELVTTLTKLGYSRQYQVEAKAEFAIRGDIVDIFPATYNHPLRVSFFGDDIEAIKEFHVSTQVSNKKVDSIEIFPSKEIYIDEDVKKLSKKFVGLKPWAENASMGTYADGMESYLPWITNKSVTLLDEMAKNIKDIVFLDFDQSHSTLENLKTEEDLIKTELELELNGSIYGSIDDVAKDNSSKKVSTLANTTIRVDAKEVGPLYDEASLLEKLKYWHENKFEVLVSTDNDYTYERLRDYLQTMNTSIEFSHIPYTRDVELEHEKVAIVNEQNFSRHNINRKKTTAKAGSEPKAVDGKYYDLNPADFVVHSTHGIGRFLGIEKKNFMGVEREYLSIEFRGNDKLFVPVDQMFAVRKYSGSDAPRLSKMGGSDFAKTKAKVKRETNHIAQQLVRLYKTLHETKGFAFSPDTPWQRELEDSFDFELTPDQATSLLEIKADMESEVPMDRLLCGDVGFGKTEVAIRATFKATQDNKQVVVLAPTTLLAHQHFETFNNRLKNFPLKVEVLSRFITPAKQKEIIKRTKAGEVDILIGTHRVLSSDVQLKNCGLLIVDEEQRFGVNHKEKIKHDYSNIDVLTLTATPIPRSLEMSVTGIREISVINTPPTNRRPILTSVSDYDETVITEAIRRELIREGQVFYLHNRVKDIELVRDKIQSLVPQATVDIAHGQMSENQLESTIQRVWDRETDVLVTTTIVESGLDLPHVNTLIVNNAHKFGLAQLYQLRGRVGRRGQRAYAYMTYPKDTHLTDQAYERLKVLGDFTDLGSGYKIAMKDLEIRGAGSLLGESQSGHIASVGFDIYCQMVRESVEDIKNAQVNGTPQQLDTDISVDLKISALIPDDYIERSDLKLDAYTKIANCQEVKELEQIKVELEDRFGDLPDVVENLFKICEIKLTLKELGFTSLKEFNNVFTLSGKALSELVQVRAKRHFSRAYVSATDIKVPITRELRDPMQILTKLQDIR